MLLKIVFAVFSFIYGLVFGSFINFLAYRTAKKEPLKKFLTDRSKCPNCKSTIRWFDNIPLISYLILKGRCRVCGYKIPKRYPLVELLGGIILLSNYLFFGFSLTFILSSLLGFLVLFFLTQGWIKHKEL